MQIGIRNWKQMSGIATILQSEAAITNIKHVRVSLVKGDMTAETTDAIVNAANTRLLHGGGLAGMISRKGGASIQAESNKLVKEQGLVNTGSCTVTGAGNLGCNYVIHAVGPIYSDYSNAEDMLSQLKASIEREPQGTLDYIRFVIFDDPTFLAFEKVFSDLISGTTQNKAPLKRSTSIK